MRHFKDFVQLLHYVTFLQEFGLSSLINSIRFFEKSINRVIFVSSFASDSFHPNQEWFPSWGFWTWFFSVFHWNISVGIFVGSWSYALEVVLFGGLWQGILHNCVSLSFECVCFLSYLYQLLGYEKCLIYPLNNYIKILWKLQITVLCRCVQPHWVVTLSFSVSFL